jgi:ABC-type uncharacterized transport system permease subunit
MQPLIRYSLVLLGDILDEGAEYGHLLGEACLGALLLLGAERFAGEVTDTVVEALLGSVEEVLGRCLEIEEVAGVSLLVLVHYFINLLILQF